MKIKSIAAICKRNKRIVLFNKYGEDGETMSQYISDGYGIYPICGLPEMDEESILTIFDIPEKDREKWFVEYALPPKEINFEDTDESERPIEEENISIMYAGRVLKPLKTRRGLAFIDSRYLSPLSDVLDALGFYERITPYGTPYIVAKDGFLLQAVIMPYDVIRTEFVEHLQELVRQCALALDLRAKEREQEAARACEEADTGQFTIDKSTGEIIEPEGGGGNG